MPYFPLSDVNNDKKLYYIDEGKGEILFFIHSWYQNGKIAFTPYLNHFTEKYRVIIPDLPGHGRSYKKKDELYSVKNATNSLVKLLKYLKKEKNKIHLVGCSMGGYMALDISLRYPELVENLILISTLIDFKASTNDIEKMLSLNNPLLKINLFLRAVKSEFPFDGRKNKFWLVNGNIPGRCRHYRQVMDNHPVFAAKEYLESFLDSSVQEEFQKNTKPTLVIYGENDKITPSDFANSVAGKMPRGMLRIIQGGGHHIYLKKPDRICKLMDEFLEEHRKRYFKWLKIFFRR